MLVNRMSLGGASRERGRQHQSLQHHQHCSPGQLALIMTIGVLPDVGPEFGSMPEAREHQASHPGQRHQHGLTRVYRLSLLLIIVVID